MILNNKITIHPLIHVKHILPESTFYHSLSVGSLESPKYYLENIKSLGQWWLPKKKWKEPILSLYSPAGRALTADIDFWNNTHTQPAALWFTWNPIMGGEGRLVRKIYKDRITIYNLFMINEEQYSAFVAYCQLVAELHARYIDYFKQFSLSNYGLLPLRGNVEDFLETLTKYINDFLYPTSTTEEEIKLKEALSKAWKLVYLKETVQNLKHKDLITLWKLEQEEDRILNLL